MLRQIRYERFNPVFQAEFANLYHASPNGQPPIPLALLAFATILQAYTGVSDGEAIEGNVLYRRWQLVLDYQEQLRAPFSKETLIVFRQRLIVHEFDYRLIEQMIEQAQQHGG
jgi:transposase